MPDAGARAALIAAEPDVYFTTSHFAGVPVVQCRLEALDPQGLTELAAEAWASRAPRRLLAEHRRRRRPDMATWDDVARICLALPGDQSRAPRGATAGGSCGTRASSGSARWAKKDVAELGDAAPTGPVVAAYVPDEGAKQAMITAEPDRYFTTSHFDGYPAVLCRLEALDPQSLTELAGEAWACRAPKRLVAEHLEAPR